MILTREAHGGLRLGQLSSPIPEEHDAWRGCLAVDENVGGAIRPEICEFDVIFIIPLPLLHGAPRCVFSLSHTRNRACFHLLPVRPVHVHIATERGRVRQASRYGNEGIDLHEIVEGRGGKPRWSGPPRPIRHTACLCAKPTTEIVRKLQFVRQCRKSLNVEIGRTHVVWNGVLMLLPSGDPQFAVHWILSGGRRRLGQAFAEALTRQYESCITSPIIAPCEAASRHALKQVKHPACIAEVQHRALMRKLRQQPHRHAAIATRPHVHRKAPWKASQLRDQPRLGRPESRNFETRNEVLHDRPMLPVAIKLTPRSRRHNRTYNCGIHAQAERWPDRASSTVDKSSSRFTGHIGGAPPIACCLCLPPQCGCRRTAILWFDL